MLYKRLYQSRLLLSSVKQILSDLSCSHNLGRSESQPQSLWGQNKPGSTDGPGQIWVLLLTGPGTADCITDLTHQYWILGTGITVLLLLNRKTRREMDGNREWGKLRKGGQDKGMTFWRNLALSRNWQGIRSLFKHWARNPVELESRGLLMPKWIIPFPKTEQMTQMNKRAQKDKIPLWPPQPSSSLPCNALLEKTMICFTYSSFPKSPYPLPWSEQFKFHCFSKGFLQKIKINNNKRISSETAMWAKGPNNLYVSAFQED